LGMLILLQEPNNKAAAAAITTFAKWTASLIIIFVFEGWLVVFFETVKPTFDSADFTAIHLFGVDDDFVFL